MKKQSDPLAVVHYCDKQYHHLQKEDSLQKLMVQLGHPLAVEYIRVRQAFDLLRYAATKIHRIYSYVDDYNFAMVSLPCLLLSNSPWPTEENIRTCAAAGWNNPGLALEYGDFSIRTQDGDLQQLLAQLLPDAMWQVVSTAWVTRIVINTPSHFDPLCGLLSQHQGDFLPLLRYPAQRLTPVLTAAGPSEAEQINSARDAWL